VSCRGPDPDRTLIGDSSRMSGKNIKIYPNRRWFG